MFIITDLYDKDMTEKLVMERLNIKRGCEKKSHRYICEETGKSRKC